MEFAPGYEKRLERFAFMGKNLSKRDAALEIDGHSGSGLFDVDRLGFEKLVGIGHEHEDVLRHYIGYQEDEAEIRGEKLDKKPLNRIFKAKYVFISGEFMGHDFKDQKFDLILARFGLNKYPFNRQNEFIKKIAQLQPSGGLVDLCAYSVEYSKHALSSVYIPIENNILKSQYSNSRTYLPTAQEMEHLFKQNGYDVIREESKNGWHSYLLKKK